MAPRHSELDQQPSCSFVAFVSQTVNGGHHTHFAHDAKLL